MSIKQTTALFENERSETLDKEKFARNYFFVTLMAIFLSSLYCLASFGILKWALEKNCWAKEDVTVSFAVLIILAALCVIYFTALILAFVTRTVQAVRFSDKQAEKIDLLNQMNKALEKDKQDLIQNQLLNRKYQEQSQTTKRNNFKKDKDNQDNNQ